MVRLIEQSRKRNSHCYVSVIISNKANAAGLPIARSMGVRTVAILHAGETRQTFEAKIHAELNNSNVELICLAGFMRILTKEFVNKWPKRIINIHPSLLPSFKGHQAVKLALQAGVKVSGCSAHYVDVSFYIQVKNKG